MTTETEGNTVSPETRIRTARIRKNACIVLFLNLSAYPLAWLTFNVLLPSAAKYTGILIDEEVIPWSLLVAFIAAAHVCRGHEIEFRERARNNPNLSRATAITQLILRLVGWTIISTVSLAVTAIFLILARSILEG